MYEGWEAADVPTAMFTILEHVAPLSNSEAVTLAISFARYVLHLAKDNSAHDAISAAERWLVAPTEQNTKQALAAATNAQNACKKLKAENIINSCAICSARDSAVTAWACGSGRDDYVDYAASTMSISIGTAMMDPENTKTREQINFGICELIRKVISNPFAKPRPYASELP